MFDHVLQRSSELILKISKSPAVLNDILIGNLLNEIQANKNLYLIFDKILCCCN